MKRIGQSASKVQLRRASWAQGPLRKPGPALGALSQTRHHSLWPEWAAVPGLLCLWRVDLEPVAAKGIDFVSARIDLAKVGNNLLRTLRNIETWEHDEEQAGLQGHISQMTAVLSLLKKAVSQNPSG